MLLCILKNLQIVPFITSRRRLLSEGSSGSGWPEHVCGYVCRCVTIDLGYLGCQTDVLLIADRLCSGRRSCAIRVPDPEMEATRPCLKELKTYLEANYTCIPSEYRHRHTQ